MKQPKKLTRRQKECLSAHYLNADNWMLVEETDFYLKIINKQTGKVRSVDKFKRTKKGMRRNAGSDIAKAGIDVLRFEHTAIVPVIETKPKRKKKSGMSFERKVIIGQWFMIGALAVMNYILQVGPI